MDGIETAANVEKPYRVEAQEPAFVSRLAAGREIESRRVGKPPVIPPPVELSDSEDDGVSPSQHKMAIMKQLSRKKVPPKSSSGSDEEEEDVEEEDADQSIDGQSGTSFDSKSSAALFSKIT